MSDSNEDRPRRLRRAIMGAGGPRPAGEGVLRREQVELDVSGASTDVPAFVGKEQPDFILINDDDLAYAKVRLDERSLRTLVDHVGEFRESLPLSLR